MKRPFVTMVSVVGNNVQDTSTDLAALIKNWLNDRYQEVQRRYSPLDTARFDYTFTTTSGTEDYVLPHDFGKEVTVVDKTNNRLFTRIDAQEWVDVYKNVLDTAGSTKNYLIYDSPVKLQPSAVGTVSIVSSIAGDTTGSVFIRGIVSGEEDTETLNLNGTTTVPGTKSFSQILEIAKTANTTGRITVTMGSDTLSVLAPNARESRYKILRLVQIPNGTFTIEIVYLQRILPLENDNDYPMLDCSDVLETGATADAWRYKRMFAKAADFEILFEKKLANLIWDYESQPNKIHIFKPNVFNRDNLF